MKLLIIFLFIINVNVAYAGENIYFKKIPSYITIDNAVIAVSKAALRRKWTVYDFENKILRIELDHRGYKAALNFSFSDGDIYYVDLTTTYDDNEFGSFLGEEGWIAEPTPKPWIRNLKDDVEIFFLENKVATNFKEKNSYENVAAKLRNLKKLLDDKLITESEYKLKKNEIMSAY